MILLTKRKTIFRRYIRYFSIHFHIFAIFRKSISSDSSVPQQQIVVTCGGAPLSRCCFLRKYTYYMCSLMARMRDGTILFCIARFSAVYKKAFIRLRNFQKKTGRTHSYLNICIEKKFLV